jgi:hypothetical protein
MEAQPMSRELSRKQIIVAILVFAGLTVLVVIRNQMNPSDTAEKKQEKILRSGNKLPARENSSRPQTRFPQDDPIYPMMNRPVPQVLDQTEMNIPPGIAPVPPEGKSETHPLPAPATKVHSLAEAGAMGVMPNYGGQVGVPQVHSLPPEATTQVHKLDAQSVTAPIGMAGNVIGVPPGIPPDEVGRTKTDPVKK